jgi:uncharacterized protein
MAARRKNAYCCRMTSAPTTALGGELDALCRRHQLADVYVFGSRAGEIVARLRAGQRGAGLDAGSRTADSDVDIAVRPLLGVRLTAAQLVDIAQSLETLFGTTRVDVVLLPTAPPYLALEAIRGELLWCRDLDDQAEYELYVLRRAGDLAPFQRFRQELALSRYATAGRTPGGKECDG